MPPAFFFFADRQNGCLFHPRQLAERASISPSSMRYPPTLTCLSRRRGTRLCHLASSSRDRRCDTSLVRERQKLLLATQGIVEIAFATPMPPIHNSPGTQSGQSRPVHPPPGSVGWLAENRKGWSPVGGDVVNFAGVRPDRRLGGPPIAINCPCGRKAR